MDNIDIKKLEHDFIVADSELHYINYVVNVLKEENRHLRQVIEMLITSSSPSL